MLSSELRTDIDKIWNTFWTRGIANPPTIIDQITYLLFIKRLDCYQNNPQFKHFFEAENLQFKPFNAFDKKALHERQELYEELTKKIWNVNRLDEQLN